MRPRSPSVAASQLGALAAVYAREFVWVAPNVAREMRRWRSRAEAIPDPTLREDALVSLERERLNVEGAALFAVLPRRREAGLLRLLVAYQIVLDFLDTLSERTAGAPHRTGVQLHRALVEARDPRLPLSDPYRHLPWVADDGGSLAALVATCRAECDALPGSACVREPAVRAAERFVVQVANHDPLPQRRDATLLAWAERQRPHGAGASWFELAAAASSTLGIHALLALATRRDPSPAAVAAVDAAYFPWVQAASTLLDSLVDRADDAISGSHNYLDHYADAATAERRIAQVVARSVAEARGLRCGERHAVIVCGMVAMYLSKESADPQLRAVARRLLRSAGGLAAIELPILRWLRRRHGLRAA